MDFRHLFEEKPEIIIIPMVDVMLFLLAFFVLIAGSIFPGCSVKVEPPESYQKSKFRAKQEVFTIVIDKKGEIYVGGNKVDFKTLKKTLMEKKKENKYLTVAINPDKKAPIQSLIEVLDAVKLCKINSVGIITKEKK